jgi:hypothetical protein
LSLAFALVFESRRSTQPLFLTSPPLLHKTTKGTMSTSNPLEQTASGSPASISSRTLHIAGILAVVHGLEEIAPSCKSVSVLWLLHGRLGSKEDMTSTASKCINDWNRWSSSDRKVGLIAVAFDQRNHGSRKVQSIANQAWKDGNVQHAQDMFRSTLSSLPIMMILAYVMPVFSMAQLLIPVY